MTKQKLDNDPDSILRLLEDGFLRADTEGKIIMANESIAKMCGYATPDAMLGLHMKELYAHAQDRDRMIKQIKKEGKIHNYELELKRKDGSTFWSLSNIKTFYDIDGNLFGTEGVIRDVTERKEFQTKLQEYSDRVTESENQLKSVLESIKDGFFVLETVDLIVTYFNKAAEDLLGKKAEDVLNKPLFDAFPEARDSIFDTNYRKVFNEKTSLSFETYFGVEPYCNWYNVHVYSGENKITVLFQVITEIKKVQLALQEANQQLSANEQQLRAANEQLTASEEELRAANQQLAANEEQLKAANEELMASEQQLRVSEQELQIKNYELTERLKEITCLYNVLNIIEKHVTIYEILTSAVQIIPPGWQYPEDTVARIRFGDNTYTSQNSHETNWIQKTDIIVNGEVQGCIEVMYLQEKPDSDEGPFLKEERSLLGSVARILGKAIEDILKNEEIRSANMKLNAANQQLAANEQQLRAANEQLIAEAKKLREKEKESKQYAEDLEASQRATLNLMEDAQEQSRKLQESQERFDLAMQASQDGLWDWNLLTNEVYLSPGWKKMLGYQDNELRNDFSTWEDLTYPEDVIKTTKLIDDFTHKRVDRFEVEIKMKHKKGHWVDVLSRADVKFDSNGTPYRMIGTHTNITEIKKVQKRLEKELHEKEILLSEVHHRVKNNLQTLSGLLQLQSDIVETKEQAIQAFEASQDRIMAMARAYELLLHSRYMSDVNVPDYVMSIVSELKYSYDPTDKVTLEFDLNECQMEIQELSKTGLIINELTTNAFKYAFKGKDKGVLRIALTEMNNILFFEISDNGVGMPEDVDFEGSDTLGLSLVSMMISELRGSLSFEVKKGTTFTFEIPKGTKKELEFS